MLRELTNVIVKATLVILEGLWYLGEISEDCEKANIISVFTKGRVDNIENSRHLQLDPCEDDKANNPGNHF